MRNPIRTSTPAAYSETICQEPRVGGASPGGREQHRDERYRQGGEPDVVQPVPSRDVRNVEIGGDERERCDTERKIHVEEPAPGEVVGDPTPTSGPAMEATPKTAPM